MMQAVVDTLAMQSLAGGGVILCMLLVRKLCAEVVNSRLIYALWLIVALRLIIPLELPGISLRFIQSERLPVARETQVYLIEPTEAVDVTIPEDAIFTETQIGSTGKVLTDALTASPKAVDHPEADVAMPHARIISWRMIAFHVWLTGVILIAGYMAYTNLRFIHKLKIKAERLHIPGKLPVYITDVDAPCVVGLFKPRIYINRAAAAHDVLPYVIRHETMHARAGDNFWLLLRNVVCALYWFHPLVWIAAALATRDCEQACDERVTRRLSRHETIEYARALIQLSAAKSMQLSVASDMISSKGVMKMRVYRILNAHICKRWLCCTVALLLLSVSALSCATGEVAGMRISAPESFDTMPEYSVNAGNIAVLADGKLYRNTDSELTLLGEYPDAVTIACAAQGIYICENSANGDVITRLGSDGSKSESFMLPQDMRVVKMACTGDDIVLAVKPEDAATDPYARRRYLVYMLNTIDGTIQKLSGLPAFDVCVDESGDVYILHENYDIYQWSISRIVNDAGDTEEVCRVEPDSFASMAVSKGGAYYCDNTGSIEYIRFEDGQSNRTVDAALYDIDAFNCIQYQCGNIYTFGYDSAADAWQLFSFEVSTLDADKARTLTIANYDNSDEARKSYMARWFDARYPAAKLSHITVDSARLATMLMAGDSGIDIIYGNAGIIGQYALSGAYHPLDDMPGLQAAVSASGLLDYRPAMSYDGKLYGVPDQVWFYAIELNEPLLEELSLEWPTAPYSWTELAEWAIPALSGTEYKLLSYMVVNPAQQYIDMALQENGNVDLDTQEFRATMAAYKRLVQSGLIRLDNNTREQGDALGALNSLYMGAYAPIPTIEGRCASPADVYGFYVSTGSDNIDLAEAYLTEFVSDECQHNCEYGYPYYMLLKETDGYSRVWRELGIERGSFDYREATENMRVAGYDSIVLKGRDYRLHGALAYKTDLQAYLTDEIDIDEYIRRVQPKLDVIQYE